MLTGLLKAKINLIVKSVKSEHFHGSFPSMQQREKRISSLGKRTKRIHILLSNST